MKVKELIAELQKYDDSLTVNFYTYIEGVCQISCPIKKINIVTLECSYYINLIGEDDGGIYHGF